MLTTFVIAPLVAPSHVTFNYAIKLTPGNYAARHLPVLLPSLCPRVVKHARPDTNYHTYHLIRLEVSIKCSITCSMFMFIFVLLGKNIGRQTATRIHEQKA